MRESTHGVDGLVSDVIIGGGIVLDELAINLVESVPHVVDLLVDLGTVVESLLTSTGNGVLDPAGMPGSNTSNLAETFVGLAGKFLCVPTACDTLTWKQRKENFKTDHDAIVSSMVIALLFDQ